MAAHEEMCYEICVYRIICRTIICGEYGTVTKHSCIVAKLAYVFFIELLV